MLLLQALLGVGFESEPEKGQVRDRHRDQCRGGVRAIKGHGTD